MSRQQRPITDRELKAWLAAGAVDRGVGEGLTFVSSTVAAQAGKASWILRYPAERPLQGEGARALPGADAERCA